MAKEENISKFRQAMDNNSSITNDTLVKLHEHKHNIFVDIYSVYIV